MSARERSRYMTTAVVFLLAFGVLGLLLFSSIGTMAQDYTFRPTAGISNTYDSTSSTQNISQAFDANVLTSATTYTNADFAGDGSTPDTVFTWSGRWSAFNQTVFFIRAVGLYVVRSGSLNSSNQWAIEYSLNGLSGPWLTLDDDTLSGTPNPLKGAVSTLTIPDDFDLQSNLMVRTSTRQENSSDAKLEIYDIRVEANWNPLTGGTEPLNISTTSLPDGDVYTAYDQLVEAVGGNTPYSWNIVSGSLPPQFTWAPSGDAMEITYSGSAPYTTPGTYDFTVQVTDNSAPTQQDQQALSIHIPGLAIFPQNGNITTLVNNPYSVTFTPCSPSSPCGTSPYTWCFVSGTIPPGLSFSPSLSTCPTMTTSSGIVLSGTPTNAGVYVFTLRLTDAYPETTDKTYTLDVSGGTQILMPTLKKMIKGITYGNSTSYPTAYQRMEAQNLTAIDVVYTPTWSSTLNTAPLSLNLALSDATFNATEKVSQVYIAGQIPVTKPGGEYHFNATITNSPGPSNTLIDIPLTILDRKTTILKAPPSTAHLPANNILQFVVSAEGGAPSNGTADSTLNGKLVPYYTYTWTATPVAGTNSPALDPSASTWGLSTPASVPQAVTITFTDTGLSGGVPLTGTYDVTFVAEDYLRRSNLTDPNYAFVPATVRIKVIAPGGTTLERETGRPTKLRQEQFR